MYMKNLISLILTLCFLLFYTALAQEFEPLVYKGYSADSSGNALNDSYDIRLMVLDSKQEDRILWSRIFLNVSVDNGYYDINVSERGNEVRELFGRGNDLIFRSVILDLGYSIQQYMSVGFQKVSLDENRIYAENFPVQDSDLEIPDLPYLPLKLLCPLENIPADGDGRIEMKIINYGSESMIIRIQLYSGDYEPKTIEFSLDAKKVRNEIIDDLNTIRLSRKGFIEVLTKSENYIITGEYISTINDSTTRSELNWRSVK